MIFTLLTQYLHCKMNHLDFPFGNCNCGLNNCINLPEGKPHIHSFDEIAIILGGTSVHVVGKEEYPIMRGDVFVIHGNQVHSNKKLKNLHIFNIVYKRDFFKEVQKELNAVPGFNTLFLHEPCFRKYHKFKARLHLNPLQLNTVIRYIELMQKEFENKPLSYSNVVEYLFKTIVINLCRYYSETEIPLSKSLIKVSRAIDYMEKNFAEDISLQTLANEAEMTAASFLRAFKKITDCTPIDYLIKLRIGMAVKMMDKNPSSRVIDISMKTGFWNSSYFSRKFRTVIGTTPMEYLKKQRGNK